MNIFWMVPRPHSAAASSRTYVRAANNGGSYIWLNVFLIVAVGIVLAFYGFEFDAPPTTAQEILPTKLEKSQSHSMEDSIISLFRGKPTTPPPRTPVEPHSVALTPFLADSPKVITI